MLFVSVRCWPAAHAAHRHIQQPQRAAGTQKSCTWRLLISHQDFIKTFQFIITFLTVASYAS
jgi:DNA-directed RNA polymerase subunit N (RpoN/RPB10)